MKRIVSLMYMVGLCLLIKTPLVQAEVSILVTYKHPTTRHDGSVLPTDQRSHYNLYTTGLDKSAPVFLTKIPGTLVAFQYNPTDPPKKAGQWCFYLTTVDKSNPPLESVPSETFCVDYRPEKSRPNKPTGFKATK